MIDDLIKSIVEQVRVLVDKSTPDELMKTLPNGQWELLNKTKPPDSNTMMSHFFNHAQQLHGALQPHVDKHAEQFNRVPLTPSQYPGGIAHKEISLEHLHELPLNARAHPALEVWGDQHEERTGQHPRLDTVSGTRGALKQYLLNLPPGQIDLGHLNRLREGSPKMPSSLFADDAGRSGSIANRILSTQDMEEILNHHVGKAQSLKEIHDKNGGLGAVEALGRTLGANAPTAEYSGLKLHPQVHTDIMDLMRPGGGGMPSPEYASYEKAYQSALDDIREESPNMDTRSRHALARKRVPPVPYRALRSTYAEVPSESHYDRAVHDTFRAMAHGDDYGSSERNMKNHENAAIARALDRFKNHHKLK